VPTNPPPAEGAVGGTTVARIIDSAEKISKIVAIIVGGIFAYYKFFRGRTFRPRLEPALEASVLQIGALKHLKAKVRVKNVGLSRVPIEREVSGLRVFVYAPMNSDGEPGDKVSPVEWRRERTVDVFKDHAWIESGETIEDNWLLSMPRSELPAAFRLELKLAGRTTDWFANAIVETPAQPEPGLLSALLGRLLPSSQLQPKGGHDEPGK
jgi:hypothetical protein